MSSHENQMPEQVSRDILRQLVGEFEVVSADKAATSSDFSVANQLYLTWQSRPGAIPHYKEMKPTVIEPSILPNMAVVDIVDGGKDYLFRVYGTAHVAQYGADLTGRRISDIEKANPASKVIRELYTLVLENRDAVFFELFYLNKNDIIKKATGVMLPLVDERGDICRLIGSMDWFRC